MSEAPDRQPEEDMLATIDIGEWLALQEERRALIAALNRIANAAISKGSVSEDYYPRLLEKIQRIAEQVLKASARSTMRGSQQMTTREDKLESALREMVVAYGSDDGRGPIVVIERAKEALEPEPVPAPGKCAGGVALPWGACPKCGATSDDGCPYDKGAA